MGRNGKIVIVTLCTFVSLPFALFNSMSIVMHALDDCRYRGAADCHAHNLAGAISIPVYVLTWLTYYFMVTRWITNKNPVGSCYVIAWILAVFAYPVIESTVDPSGLRFFLMFDLLPVAPALLLGFYLAFISDRIPERILIAIVILTLMWLCYSWRKETNDPFRSEKVARQATHLFTTVPVNPELKKFGRLYPSDIARLSDGTIYLANGDARPVIKIDKNGIVSEIAIKATRMARDRNDQVYFLTASGAIQRLDKQNRIIKVIENVSERDLNYIDSQITADEKGSVYFSTGGRIGNYVVDRIDIDGRVSKITSRDVHSPAGDVYSAFAADDQGNFYFATGARIVKMNSSKVISNLVGDDTSVRDLSKIGHPKDGNASEATFDGFRVMRIDHNGNIFFISDGDSVRKITPEGNVTTVLKQGCVVGEFEFNIPNIEKAGCSMGLIDGSVKQHKQYLHIDLFDVDESGNIYYVDTWSNAIRKATTDGVLSTIIRGEFPSR